MKNETKSKGKGTASMVLGILSLCFLLLFPVSTVLGIIAIVLGYKQNKEYKTAPASAGLVMGIISVSLTGVWYVLFFGMMLISLALP